MISFFGHGFFRAVRTLRESLIIKKLYFVESEFANLIASRIAKFSAVNMFVISGSLCCLIVHD